MGYKIVWINCRSRSTPPAPPEASGTPVPPAPLATVRCVYKAPLPDLIAAESNLVLFAFLPQRLLVHFEEFNNLIHCVEGLHYHHYGSAYRVWCG